MNPDKGLFGYQHLFDRNRPSCTSLAVDRVRQMDSLGAIIGKAL